MAASITDTQGIVAIAAGALRAGGAAGVRGAERQRAPAAHARSGWCSASSGEQDVVAHAAAHAGGVRGRCARTCRTTATRLDGRLAAVETALRGRIAHRALVRYDAYNELSGQQSMSIALLDDEQLGDRAVVHPPSRPGARVRQAGARRARRTRALARGGRGRAPGARARGGGTPGRAGAAGRRDGGSAGDEQPA